jgi:putative transposase
VKGRKRHIIVDTLGLVLALAVHPADVQDRDGAALVLVRLRPLFCWVRTIFAAAAYDSDRVAVACLALGITALIIVRRLAAALGFQVLPKRWIVLRRTMLLVSVSRGRRWSPGGSWSVPGGMEIVRLS